MLAAERCQDLPTPGGRTCALKAAGAARTRCGLDALRFPSWRGFLRGRSVSGETHNLITARGLRFQFHRARGRAPALEQGLDGPGSSALRRPGGAGAPSRQARRLPGLPAVLRQRLSTA